MISNALANANEFNLIILKCYCFRLLTFFSVCSLCACVVCVGQRHPCSCVCFWFSVSSARLLISLRDFLLDVSQVKLPSMTSSSCYSFSVYSVYKVMVSLHLCFCVCKHVSSFLSTLSYSNWKYLSFFVMFSWKMKSRTIREEFIDIYIITSNIHQRETER